MAKPRTAYVCTECGADSSKWQGQCGACGAWDTLSEFVLETAATAKASAPARRGGWAGKIEAPQVTPLKDVRHTDDLSVSTGIGEFDRPHSDAERLRHVEVRIRLSGAELSREFPCLADGNARGLQP
jgi:predicted ATP-dependent serine protease